LSDTPSKKERHHREKESRDKDKDRDRDRDREKVKDRSKDREVGEATDEPGVRKTKSGLKVRSTSMRKDHKSTTVTSGVFFFLSCVVTCGLNTLLVMVCR